MRTAGIWISAIIVGLVVGVALALFTLKGGGLGGQATYSGWTYSKYTGSAAAGPLVRAKVARAGLLALNKSETIYFNLEKDERGRPLTDKCAYELKGGAFPARWWSITIYAPDNYLPQNHDQAQSIDDTRIKKDAGGGWTAEVSLQRPGPTGAPNWISTWNAGKGFSLTLRLYNPSPEAAADPKIIAFPTVHTLSCSGGASTGNTTSGSAT